MRRAVLYTRLSVSSDDSVSLARQRRQLEELCEREGLEVVATFEDDGLSGGKRRVNADAALDMLRQGRADALVCPSMDRWSRQGLRAVAELLEVLEERPGTEFITANGLRSTDSTFGLIAAVIAEIAKAEREATRDRVTMARRHLATNEHRWPAGRTVYGYRTCPHPSGVGMGLEPDPEEAPLIVELFERVARGDSTLSIAKDWNARGLRTRSVVTRGGVHKPGAEWTTTRLRRLLTNDSVLGHMTYKGKPILDEEGYPLVIWEPLISAELWHSVQAIIGQREKAAPRQRREALLSGLLRCASCGSGMTYEVRGEQSALYRCIGAKQGKSCPEPVAISATIIEPHIVGMFLDKLGDREEIRPVAVDTGAARRAEIESAITALLAGIPEAESDEEALSMTRKLRAMQRELESLPTTLEQEWRPTGRTIGEAWEESSTGERNLMLTTMLRPVRVRRARARGVRVIEPGRLQILWKLIPVRHPGGITLAEPLIPPDDDEEAWNEL